MLKSQCNEGKTLQGFSSVVFLQQQRYASTLSPPDVGLWTDQVSVFLQEIREKPEEKQQETKGQHVRDKLRPCGRRIQNKLKLLFPQ